MTKSMNRCALRLSLILGLLVATTLTAAAPRAPAAGTRRGRILVIRGLTNVFSLGMDDLACQLSQLGYQVDVTPPALCDAAALLVQSEYLRDPSIGPLVIIGHSMGGRKCCEIPWTWRQHGIPVKLVVILDSNPDFPVADNVERCVNFYVTNQLGVFHGRPIASEHVGTNVVNIDVTKIPRPPDVPNVNHFDIDDSPWIHSLVVAEVERTLGCAETVSCQSAAHYAASDFTPDADSLTSRDRFSREALTEALQSRIDAVRARQGMKRPVRIQ